MKNKNLSFKLSIYFLVSVTILSVIVIIIGYYYVRNSLLENYRYRVLYEGQEVLGEVKNTMDDAVRFAKNLESDFRTGHLNKKPENYIRMAFSGQHKMYSFSIITEVLTPKTKPAEIFSLTRSHSGITSCTGKADGYVLTSDQWFNRMLNVWQPEWSAPFYNAEINKRLITYGLPFEYDKEGQTIRTTIFCTVSIDPDFELLQQHNLINSGQTYVLNESNRIVYHPDRTKTGEPILSVMHTRGKVNTEKILTDRLPGYQLLSSSIFDHHGKIVIYWPDNSFNWLIINVFPANLFMSELKKAALAFILLILSIAGITAGVTIYLSIRLVSPISVMADDSRKMMAEAAFDPALNRSNSDGILNSSRKSEPFSELNDLDILTGNLALLREHLAIYRKNSVQTSLDKVALDKELMMAHDIEMSMVPTEFPLFPDRNDFNCFGRLIPARIVGGDLFDIFLLTDDQLFISISDTLGKGIPAAMFSVITRTFIRSIANPITRLGKIMECLNDELSVGLKSGMFATVFMGKLDLITGEFIYCNAGHPHPFILRNNQQEEVLTQSHGIPVGLKRNLQFAESSTFLAPGESLITYTDGVTEEYNADGEFFGSDRLISVVKPFCKLSARHIVASTLDALDHFRGREEAHDDTTLVAIQYTGK